MTDPHAPWPAVGLATAIGSMPGSDPAESAAIVAGELPDLPHLVELPARGVGADMLGRALAICIDMPGEVVPSGWRLTRKPGRDMRRAIDYLAWDLDAAEQVYAGAAWLKVQVAGPWTLAAGVETARGHRALTDAGAVRDIAASLAEGLREHLAELARRLPGTGLIVQLDEPSLPAVIAGMLRTASGIATVPAVPGPDTADLLAEVLAALPDSVPAVAHCCAAEVPVAQLRRAGFNAISLDMAQLPTDAAHLDPIAELMEAGGVLLAGLAPGADFRAATAPLTGAWHRLGLPDRTLDRVVVTPPCGLAAAADPARELRLLRDMARHLADLAHN